MPPAWSAWTAWRGNAPFSVLGPDLDVLFASVPGGVDATVTPAGDGPVATRIIWRGQPATLVVAPDPSMTDRRLRCDVRRDHVPTLPEGSTILAACPPVHPTPKLWTVHQIERLDPEILTAVVQ